MASVWRVGSGPQPHQRLNLMAQGHVHDPQAVVDAMVKLLRSSGVDPEGYTIFVRDTDGENWPCPSDIDYLPADGEC